jgi:HEAT repeat protein
MESLGKKRVRFRLLALAPGLALVLLAGGIWLVWLLPQPAPPGMFYRNRPLQDWCQAAAAGNSDARAAMEEMGPKAVPGLTWLVNHRDPFYQRWAWELAGRLPLRWCLMIRQKVGVPVAISTREAAARSLGLIGRAASNAAPALVIALREPGGRLRWEAAEALGRLGSNAVTSLVPALRSGGKAVRHSAAYATGLLGREGQGAVPALMANLGDPSEEVRQSSAYALFQIGAPAMLALIDWTRQSQPKRRELAVQTLGNFGRWTNSPVAPLIALAEDPDPGRRQAAIEALGDFRPRDFRALQAFLNALRDPAPPVRVAALKVLARLDRRSARALPSLLEGLRHESPPVRQWSARVLGVLGSAASNAVPELKRLKADPDAAVGAAAGEALARIESAPRPK